MKRTLLLFVMFLSGVHVFSQKTADTSQQAANAEVTYVLVAGTTVKVTKAMVDSLVAKNAIEKVNVLKGQAATGKYGPGTEAGVIEVYPKSPKEQNKPPRHEMSVADLCSATAAGLLMLEPGLEIVQWTFTIGLDNGSIAQVNNSGSSVHTETRKLAQNAKAGDLVTIDNIRARKDGREIRIPSRIWYIVE